MVIFVRHIRFRSHRIVNKIAVHKKSHSMRIIDGVSSDHTFNLQITSYQNKLEFEENFKVEEGIKCQDVNNQY